MAAVAFLVVSAFALLAGCGAVTERATAGKIEIEQYNTITDAYNNVVAAERALVDCQGETDCSAASAYSLQVTLKELAVKTDGLSQGGSDACSLSKANIFYHAGQAADAASAISELAEELSQGEGEEAKGDALARAVREYNATVDTLNARMNDIEKSYLGIRDNCLSEDVLTPTDLGDSTTTEIAPGDAPAPGEAESEVGGAEVDRGDAPQSTSGSGVE